MGPHVASAQCDLRAVRDLKKPFAAQDAAGHPKEPIMNPIQMESLEVRIQMAVTAAYLPFAHSLSVFGDSLDNQIVVSRDAAGKILVNGGAVPIFGGSATVANTSLVAVFGLGGNDNISLNEANGALPAAQLFGGDGNDILTR